MPTESSAENGPLKQAAFWLGLAATIAVCVPYIGWTLAVILAIPLFVLSVILMARREPGYGIVAMLYTLVGIPLFGFSSAVAIGSFLVAADMQAQQKQAAQAAAFRAAELALSQAQSRSNELARASAEAAAAAQRKEAIQKFREERAAKRAEGK